MRRAIRVLNAVGCGLVGIGAIAMLLVGSGGGLLTEAPLIIGGVAWISALVLWVIAGTIWMALDDVIEVPDAKIEALQAEISRLKAEIKTLKK